MPVHVDDALTTPLPTRELTVSSSWRQETEYEEGGAG